MHKNVINPSITANLSSIIQYTKPYWSKNITPKNISKLDFLRKNIPNNGLIDNQYTPNTLQLRNSTSIDIALVHTLLEKCKQLLNASTVTNVIMYQPLSEMPWHTDYKLPGTRIYYTFTTGESIFRYQTKNGKIVEEYDDIGWTARTFSLGDESSALWHTIWTEKVRFSFGFKL